MRQVSVNRLQCFFGVAEVEQTIIEADGTRSSSGPDAAYTRRMAVDKSQPAIEIIHADFRWSKKKSDEENLTKSTAKPPSMFLRICCGVQKKKDDEDRWWEADSVDKARPGPGGGSGGALPSTLRDITFSVPPGALTCVIGRVGTGKSTLLSALLNEVPCTAGRVSISGEIAYCAQLPWIQNKTVRENVKNPAIFHQFCCSSCS